MTLACAQLSDNREQLHLEDPPLEVDEIEQVDSCDVVQQLRTVEWLTTAEERRADMTAVNMEYCMVDRH